MTPPTDAEAIALKRCPFCGGEAAIQLDQGRNTVGVGCTKCTACQPPSWSIASEYWARAAWNARVLLPSASVKINGATPMPCNTCGGRRTIAYAESTCQAAHEGPCPSCVGVTIATFSLPSASVATNGTAISEHIADSSEQTASHIGGEREAFEEAAVIAETKGGYFAIPAKEGRSLFEHVGAAIAAAIRDRAALAAPETPPTEGECPTCGDTSPLPECPDCGKPHAARASQEQPA